MWTRRTHGRSIGLPSTENCPWRQTRIRGVVHDENAYVVGGVDGHAGLFGTAADVHGLLMEIFGTYSGDRLIIFLIRICSKNFWTMEKEQNGHWDLIGRP